MADVAHHADDGIPLRVRVGGVPTGRSPIDGPAVRHQLTHEALIHHHDGGRVGGIGLGEKSSGYQMEPGRLEVSRTDESNFHDRPLLFGPRDRGPLDIRACRNTTAEEGQRINTPNSLDLGYRPDLFERTAIKFLAVAFFGVALVCE